MSNSKHRKQKTNQKSISKAEGTASGLWNALTVITILVAIGILIVFGSIFLNPYVPYNPYPPPTLPAALVLPENAQPGLQESNSASQANAAALSIEVEPTFPLESPNLSFTATPLLADSTSTATLIPSTTSTPWADIIEITALPENTDPARLFYTATATPRTAYIYPFALLGEPEAISAYKVDPNRGCDWMGVGGQVFNLEGRPLTGISVMINGTVKDLDFDHLVTLSGTAPQYGKAGFEFTLSDRVLASNKTLKIWLADQTSEPISAGVTFSTYADCSRNLILINFEQKR